MISQKKVFSKSDKAKNFQFKIRHVVEFLIQNQSGHFFSKSDAF